jgi:hypothetical protein
VFKKSNILASIKGYHESYFLNIWGDLMTNKAWHLGALVLVCFGAGEARAAAPPAACPIARTIYAQPGNPGVTAGFAKQGIKTSYASDLVFYVKRGKDVFWFGLESPNGYGGTYLYPRIDPKLVKANVPDGDTPSDAIPALESTVNEEGNDRAQIDFDGFDLALKTLSGPPQSTSKAPAYLFARGLGPFFHYAHNYNYYKLLDPVPVEIAMWRPIGCQKSAQ